jgi:hypothetical protein
LPEGLSFEAWIEGRRIVLDAVDEGDKGDDGKRPSPQLGIDSSGEFTAFEMLLRRDAEPYVQRIRPDANGELEQLAEGGTP